MSFKRGFSALLCNIACAAFQGVKCAVRAVWCREAAKAEQLLINARRQWNGGGVHDHVTESSLARPAIINPTLYAHLSAALPRRRGHHRIANASSQRGGHCWRYATEPALEPLLLQLLFLSSVIRATNWPQVTWHSTVLDRHAPLHFRH